MKHRVRHTSRDRVHAPRYTAVDTMGDIGVIILEDTGKSLVMDELANLIQFTVLLYIQIKSNCI